MRVLAGIARLINPAAGARDSWFAGRPRGLTHIETNRCSMFLAYQLEL
jgi:hypothetical protein